MSYGSGAVMFDVSLISPRPLLFRVYCLSEYVMKLIFA